MVVTRGARFTPPIREQIPAWLKEQPDRTLWELQAKLAHEADPKVRLPSIWTMLNKMELLDVLVTDGSGKPVPGLRDEDVAAVRVKLEARSASCAFLIASANLPS